MSMQQIIEMLAKAEAKQEDMLKRMDKTDSNQEKMDADRLANQFLLTKMNEDRKAYQEKMAADLLGKMNEHRKADQVKMEDFLARIGQETKDHLSRIDQSTQNLRTELTDEIQKTKVELQTVEVSIDKRTR
jgi:hypothetical protein